MDDDMDYRWGFELAAEYNLENAYYELYENNEFLYGLSSYSSAKHALETLGIL